MITSRYQVIVTIQVSADSPEDAVLFVESRLNNVQLGYIKGGVIEVEDRRGRI